VVEPLVRDYMTAEGEKKERAATKEATQIFSNQELLVQGFAP
jgi:hypothetical protein